ncbi:hypothetical protein Lsai_2267 [Legionella sainthelensi]|uniref:Uncharacterized protein n=2 Tax=Legionella sainthelensi TaxID=28087 RepID=A0A0W0YGQ7_9GAMM|nr:hypothetical protein Lsai_2267 [Legionella sainthelensi]VEH35177.1 Uncharacterised protein [Legionella sainthelensi]
MQSIYENLIHALAPYSQLIFIIIVALFVIIVSQLFLAKYVTQSIYYWRNIPYLSLWVYTMAHSRLIKYPLSLAIVLSVMRLYPRDYWLIVRKSVHFYRLKKLFSKLDDIIDTASPDSIIALGDASLGIRLNSFLKKLLDQDDLLVLNQFIDQKLITKKELHAFCNLFANKLALQARLTVLYNSKKNMRLREKIAAVNIEISGAYLALLVHFIKKDPRILDFIEQNGGLTYSALKPIYPKATQGGELIQIAHDIIDFRYDLIQQPKIGKICANVFLAKLAQNYESETLFPLILSLPARPVNIYELSDTIRFQLSLMERDFKIRSFKINIIFGLLYTVFWEYIKRAGFTGDKLKYQKTSYNVGKSITNHPVI